jgi:micrococcal nuclease
MPLPSYNYNVLSHRLLDGDTLDVVVDLGFNVSYSISCRVLGIDTPEHTTNAGLLVKQVFAKWLAASKKLTTQSVKFDKFGGRYDGSIFNDAGQSWSVYALSKGLARPYNGEKKPAWTNAELSEIEQMAHSILNQ